MAKEIPEIIRRATLEKIASLSGAARQAYENNENTQATRLYQEAANLAKEIEDFGQVVKLLFWSGDALYLDYQDKNALVLLYEALSYAEKPEIDPADIFRVILRIISIGIQLPSSLPTIENMLERARLLITQKGRTHWYGMYKFSVGFLAIERGQFQQAFEAVQEGLAKDNHEYPSFSHEAYFDLLIYTSLKLGNIEDTNYYLAKMETISTNFQTGRINMVKKSKVRIGLYTGEFNEALNWARKIDSKLPGLSFIKLEGYVSNLQTGLVKDILIEYLWNYRNHESGSTRLQVRLIWGDYYQSILRLQLHLPKASQEWSTQDLFEISPELEFAQTHVLVKSTQTQIPLKDLYKWFRNARVAYLQALSIAEMIDEKLVCTYNTEVAETRLNRLFFLYQACGGKLERREFMLSDISLLQTL